MNPSIVDDPARLAALDALAILDTPAEPGFDDAVRLAARLCAAPVALVSLVAGDRQWFKARLGFPHCETDLNASVCKFVLVEPDFLVIPDLATDPRTCGNRLVTGEPGIRFYAGAPLRLTDGEVVGSLCVIDTVPRPDGLLPEQADDLRALGRQVATMLEARRTEASNRRNIDRVQLALAAGAIIGTWFWDLPTDRFTVDEGFARSFGLDPALGREGIPLAQIVATVHPDDQAGLARAIADVIIRGGAYAHQYRVQRADGRYYWIEANGRVDRAPDGTALSFPGVLLDIEGRRGAEEALRASEAHWRGLFERLSEGFLVGEVVRDENGHIVDWRYVDVNAAWGTLVGLDPGGVVGRTLREVLPDVEDTWVDEFAGVVETGHAVTFTRRVGVLRRWYEGRAFPLGPERFGMIFLDVTARVEADARRDALLELGERLRNVADVPALLEVAAGILARATDATRAGYGLVDPARETVEVLTDWHMPGSVSVSGLHDFRTYGSYIEDLQRGEVVAIDDVTLDPRTRDTAAALLAVGARVLLNVPILERGRLVGIAFVHWAEAHPFAEDDLAFVRTVADRVQIAVARLQAEADQRVLNEELSHRLKNTLAMVISIATQTLRTVPDRAPVEAFERRIHALSSAHDVLLRQSWASAPAREVMRAVLANAGQGDRIDLAGPELDLGPRATLSLSLLLHELATNAAKYGALSVPGGRVSLSWQLAGEGEGREVTLDWTERGGPPPTPPASSGRKGFGSRLIRLGLVGTGGVDLRYPASGFQATMRAPLVQLQHS